MPITRRIKGDIDQAMPVQCEIHALRAAIPDIIVTNQDIANLVETSDQWIVERTGIHERRKLQDNENASSLGLRAARAALSDAGLDATELTHVVVSTCTPDHLSPSVACIIAGELGAGPVMAFDMSAACTGFVYGLSLCQSLLCSGKESRILFVCTEALTRRVNWKDRSTCVLFGDAAAACVIDTREAGALFRLTDVICESDGLQKNLIVVGGGTSCRYSAGDSVEDDFFISMQGRDTYKHAVRQMVNVCEKILRKNGVGIDDIDLFVPHQANMRIIEAVGNRLKIDPARVFTNVGQYGNTSAASIPLALREALNSGDIRPGSRVLVSAFGAGLTWGAALLDF